LATILQNMHVPQYVKSVHRYVDLHFFELINLFISYGNQIFILPNEGLNL
jgi:hypothetical protein